MNAKVDDATGYAYGRFSGLQRSCIGTSILFKQFWRVRGPIELVGIGFVAARLDFSKFFLALDKLIDWVKR